MTFESIHLPPLEFKPNSTIEACLLFQPPSRPDSTIFVFDSGISSIWFCRIQDQQWLTYCYENEIDAITDTSIHELGQNIVLCCPVSCNNKIYALTIPWSTLIGINLIEPNHIVLESLGKLPLPNRQIANWVSKALVESCGDIFLISSYYRSCLEDIEEPEQVIDMELNMLDLSSREWVRVSCAKSRAFFLGSRGRPSWSICCSEELGNCIYFLCEEDCCLHAYHIEDWHMSTSLLCPDLFLDWHTPIWLMPDRLTELDGEAAKKMETEVSGNKQTAEECKKYHKAEEKESNRTGLFDIPREVLRSICDRLSLIDYMNFQILSTLCREVAPPLQFETAVCRSETQSNSLSPWLVSLQENGLRCALAHPHSSEIYQVRVPDYLQDATPWHCQHGWLLVSNLRDSIQVLSFLNPFTKRVIPYQDLDVRVMGESRIAFSSPPTCPNCVVVVISSCGVNSVQIRIFRSRAESWMQFLYSSNQHFSPSSDNPIFSNGAFYFLGVHGNIGILRFQDEGYNWQVIEGPESVNISPRESFLAELDGLVFLVHTYEMGKWLKLFRLDPSSLSWSKVENLGNHTLHVSRSSAIFTVAKSPEAENKIYFPRFFGEHLISYSLLTNSLHSSATGVSLTSYKCGIEPLFCGWVHPSWS